MRRDMLGEKATEDTRCIHKDSQQRKHDGAGDDPGDYQQIEGVDGKGFKSVDLLGGAHVRELRSNAGAHAPRHQQGGDQGANLIEERK